MMFEVAQLAQTSLHLISNGDCRRKQMDEEAGLQRDAVELLYLPNAGALWIWKSQDSVRNKERTQPETDAHRLFLIRLPPRSHHSGSKDTDEGTTANTTGNLANLTNQEPWIWRLPLQQPKHYSISNRVGCSLRRR
jgi:hypothetical protein